MAESAPFSTHDAAEGGTMDDECRIEAIHQADELAFPMRLEAELAAATAPLHQTIAELRQQMRELQEHVEALWKSPQSKDSES